jgi:hypothetical protein
LDFIPQAFQSLTGLENMNRLMIGFVFFAFIGLIFLTAIFYFSIFYFSTPKASHRVKMIADKTVKQRQEQRLSMLKTKRKTLNAWLKKLKIKEPYGLTAEEEKKKKFYEQEYARVEEELLNNELFMDQLITRAEHAFGQAKSGVPSKQIKKQLFKEGYTKKEVRIIERLFNKKKQLD